MAPLEQLRRDLRAALLSLDRLGSNRILVGYRKDASLPEVTDDLIVPVLEDIGNDWERGKLALSEVYMAGRLAGNVVDAILATEPAGLSRPQPRLGAAVLDDVHVLGKQMVLGVLRTAGYHVDDLGSGVTVDAAIDAVREHDTEVLLVSVLMLRSALLVPDLKRRLAEEGLDVRIIVGGAPFRLDPNLWREVGADGCGASASDALAIVSRLAVRA